MMPRAATAQYRTQQRLTAEAVAASRRLWRRVDPASLDASWASVLPAVMAVTLAAQSRAAEAGAEYVPSVRDELNISERIEGEVRPASLVGTSSTGVPLELALVGGVTHAKSLIGKGMSPRMATIAGGNRLAQTMQLQVADAGRIAASVGAMGDRSLTRYTRMLVTPSCSRCVILAGQISYMDTAFLRHPRCDCRNIPCNEDTAKALSTDPQEYFDSIDEPEQDRIFTKAGAQAIRDGADMNQVVNARRGMYTTKGGNLATRAGSTQRGAWGSSQTVVNRRTGARERPIRRHRMMPETIYGLTDNRAEQIRLLKYYRFMD